MERDTLQVQLNEEQAKQFAKAIFADIAAYVEAHKEELELLLSEELNEL